MSLDGQSQSNFAAAGAPSPSNAKLRSMERTYCESVDILLIYVKIPALTRISSLSLSTPTKDQVDFVVHIFVYMTAKEPVMYSVLFESKHMVQNAHKCACS